MPRAPRHCRHHGCTTLVYGSTNYCPEHKPAPWQGSRTQSSTLTSTAAWKRLAEQVKRRDHYECQIRGPHCTRHATTVDKIIPVSRRPDLALDPDNCRAACSNCNEHKGRTSDRGGTIE